MDFSKASLDELIAEGGYDCACGRHHETELKYLKIGSGVISYLPEAMSKLGVKKPFIVCDKNTEKAAWSFVEPVLRAAQVPYVKYVLPYDRVEPDEMAVGSLCMAFDPTCDVVLGIGSGVVNDCSKVLAHTAGRKSMIVGIAPSMDGYASNSASMIQDRIKVSLYNACPAAIIADTQIIKEAPMRMLWAGLGDMLAKYVSLCEWRISNIVTGEYYCENIAGLMRTSLNKIVDAAPRLALRDEAAVYATVEGLILSGIAMGYAQISRPASGLEHYFSHIWEMMALDRGTPYELHGIQVGVGTLITLQIFDVLRAAPPSREKAEAFLQDFDPALWEQNVRRVFGKAAQAVLDKAAAEKKNDPEAHKRRMEILLTHWDEIVGFMEKELPKTEEIKRLMELTKAPTKPEEIGVSAQDVADAFHGSRDSRDKYLTSTMLWDLGALYDFPLFTKG